MTDIERAPLEFTLNEKRVKCWVFPNQTLLEVLRDEIGANEVKYGCGEGVCGTCTVLLDDNPVNSCLIFGIQVRNRRISTVHGLSANGDGMHPLQRSFLEGGAAQCGFCTPGMLLTAYAFLEENPRPSRGEIRQALAGNLCRCTGYTKIVEAVEAHIETSRGTSERNGG